MAGRAASLKGEGPCVSCPLLHHLLAPSLSAGTLIEMLSVFVSFFLKSIHIRSMNDRY
jgi:hypothetical protein